MKVHAEPRNYAQRCVDKRKLSCVFGSQDLAGVRTTYSVRNEFTGLALAALIDWKLTVAKVTNTAPPTDTPKNHQWIGVR